MDKPNHWPTLYEDIDAVNRLKKSVRAIKLNDNDKVLDVGCNNYELAKYLPDTIHYHGIDHIHGIEVDGGFELEEEFDVIFCLETLEHLKYPKKTLASIRSHLRPGGYAVISLPNEATLFHRIRSLMGVVDQECFSEAGKHLHLPSLAQAKTFLSEEFLIVDEDYYISSQATASRQAWISWILRLVPAVVLTLLAYLWPSMFARGFIFTCYKKSS